MIDLSRKSQDVKKKMLSLDGGGIRGVISLCILEKIEALVRDLRQEPDMVLGDYFDYVAGTSTGAIIAAGVATGMNISKILSFYIEGGAMMFSRARLINRLFYSYDSEPLARQIKGAFGSNTTLGSSSIKPLLLLVLRNATTDSPWLVTNNPYAKYNSSRREDCNLKLPLWQLIRASTAAPTYFPPEMATVGDRSFIFVDGGVTSFNNPAFQMFLMATSSCYWPNAPADVGPWEAGENNVQLISVGTGKVTIANDTLRASSMHRLYNAFSLPSALMNAAAYQQDVLCRTFGRCIVGEALDREVGDLKTASGPLADKLFTYLRYDVELTKEGLARIGCDDIAPLSIQRLDDVKAIEQLLAIGRAYAEEVVKIDDLRFDEKEL